MKAYAQFFIKDGSGKLAEGLGTDSIMPLDARLSIESMRRETLVQNDRLKNVRTFVAYQIRLGNIASSTPLTGITVI
jgi:hypothetical protein